MQDKTFFKEAVLKDYLANLLDDTAPPSTIPATDNKTDEQQKLKVASALLQKAEQAQKETQFIKDAPKTSAKETEKNSLLKHKEIASEVETKTQSENLSLNVGSLKERLNEQFQALFFDVAGLTLAVPLVELGGIHQLGETSHIIGKPSWFKGVMIKGDEKINCVDTSLWVMPKQVSKLQEDSIKYKYLVMLGKSNWGLMCEALINTVELNHDDIKWREDTQKRPWLAGTVKDKMCALINASSFIEMLETNSQLN